MRFLGSRRDCRLHLAMLLLALFPLAVRCQSPITTKEDFILRRFYDVAGGLNWTNDSGWNDSTVPICSWYGIGCLGDATDNQGVINISLASNNLVGHVTKLIYALPQLKSVDLQRNPGITNGGFDGFETQRAQIFLQVLQFTECSLTSLGGLENAPSTLTELHLTGNQLKGTFPSEVLVLTSLEALYLSFNKIKGTLPTQIGSLSKLKNLFLSQNLLTGQLPTELGNLNQLQVFTIAESLVSGSLPTELNQLSNLKTLSCHRNNENAGGLDGPLLDFAGLPLLSELYLDGNDLTGTIPLTFLNSSQIKDSTITIGLSNNQLTGALPRSLDQFKFLDIDLVGNSISLIPISFCSNQGWMGGLVGSFGCDAILCEAGSYNVYGRQISIDTPCLHCNQPISDFWGSTSCGTSSTNSTLQLTLDILAVFYRELSGAQWYNQSGWYQMESLLMQLSSNNVSTAANFTARIMCEWYGIACDESDRVIQISLPNNGLAGTIPTEIGALSTLRVLDLSANQAVTVQRKVFWKAIGGSKSLTTLNFADTGIYDLEGIGEAPQMQDLTLDGVYFARALPTDLFQLTNLKSLHMQYNMLTGRLPSLIGYLSNLEVLNFYNNELSGPLPSELGLLSAARILDLSENRFNSTLPTDLQLLTALSQMYLHQTFGALSGPLPSFNHFALLNELTLDSNILSGTIPSSFLQDVYNKSQPIYVGLSFNRFAGMIPSELASFYQMDLLIEGNSFTEIPPQLCNKELWMNGEVGRVGGCSAIGCPARSWNIYGKASSFINASCESCPSNRFVGQTYCTSNQTAVNGEELDEVKILNLLFVMTNGPKWTLPDNNNWTRVGVPICDREGVTCINQDNNSGVVELNLFSFGLRGKVPRSIFSLPDLRRLNLNNNSVEVDFGGVGNATKLAVLQLSSTRLHNLDGLGDASPTLSELNLAFNDLSGSFPSEIMNLRGLKMLLLQQNQFSGSIPSEVEHLKQLQELWLDGNVFSGQLPTELGNLTSLQVLSFRDNYLSGSIPLELSKLSRLAHLDLSRNQLDGSLPPFDAFTQLTVLRLNGNKIAGTISENFMAMSKKDTPILVDLSQNSLTGAIPTSLGRFSDLFLDLTGNKITYLPQTFCNKSKWMDGMVGQLKSCDAILCPPGTYSDAGRETVAGGSCKGCASANSTIKYYGQTKCLSVDNSFEREILKVFYDALNGTGWINQTNWMSEGSVCTWFGVGCDAGGFVVSLVLDMNNLANVALAPEAASKVLMLPNLQVLNLRGNGVRFDLTQFSANSSNLLVLEMSGNYLVSLRGIGRAQKLQELHITDNGLQGTIPDELFLLTDLKKLYMSFNEFTGTLSGKLFANLSRLEEFYMFGNNITGTLPTEVGNLRNLREFIMPSNHLNGTLPSEFSYLPLLAQLALYDQQGKAAISGKIPTFANSPKLQYFDMSSNSLTGSIPDSFMAHSIFRNSTVTIHLSNNIITGTVPSALGQFSKLDIQLDGNQIVGIPPQLCKLSQWMDGAVGQFGCDAILCHNGSYNSLGHQDSVNNTCLPCPSGSPYLGQRRCIDLHSERALLSLLYNTTGGTSWKKKSNWNSQDPICSWEGALCEGGQTTNDLGVTGLYLAENNLQGTFPPIVWSLPLLRSMHLGNNPNLRVTMEGLSNATNLQVLNLNSVKLDTVAGVSSAKMLSELHITDCSLSGTLPEDIFDLGPTLQGLYVAFNSFHGTLSTMIGLLTNLKELFAYDNDFSGSIPTEIGKLSSLTDLVLAENLLSGSLPTQLSSMPNIQVISLYRRAKSGPKLIGNLASFDKVPYLIDLFLDHNEIQGTIPPNFLTSSVNAQNIIVSFNQLNGTIPLQLGYFSAVNLELEGNKISGFDKSFCAKTGWMNGQVAGFGCDAILCPPRQASFPFGRAFRNASNVNTTCVECSSTRSAPFYGSTTCDIPVDVPLLLRFLYNTCNGKNWINQNFWATNADYCTWYGVGCSNSQELISINLTANNLTGTIPDSLFQISTLQFLFLQSNFITFKFPFMTSTTNLQELRLDNTGLVSLKGISIFTSLTTLNVERNLIQGPFYHELVMLSNLRALYVGENQINGTFPTFLGQLPYLRTLSVRSNGIEGGLSVFEDSRVLTNVDLSHNKFTGSIPSLLFDRISSFAPLVVDLSRNALNGTIPSSLSRFRNISIYLQDNQFTGIPIPLCSNGGWNGGEVALFGCDAILCPPGTYSPLGRSSERVNCVNCTSASFYGETNCSSAPIPTQVQTSGATTKTYVPQWTRFGCFLWFLVVATTRWIYC